MHPTAEAQLVMFSRGPARRVNAWRYVADDLMPTNILKEGSMRLLLEGFLAFACFSLSVFTAANYPLARSNRPATSSNSVAQELDPRGEGAAPAADQPTPRLDQNSRIAHTELLEKARKGGIDVYFVGDSITRRWGTSDEQYKKFLANWRQNFFGWNAANFGWGGDTIQNILWRLSNGELDNVNPKIIVVMAGTNNVGNRSPRGGEDPRVSDITRGIKALLDLCRRKAPNATIVLMGITPRNDNMAVMPVINKVNSHIAKFADGEKIRYVNINDKLTDKEGKFLEGMANRDGLHLDVRGYQVWADALKPIFTELLGPPAKEDHAPAPTGDPSIRKRPAARAAPDIDSGKSISSVGLEKKLAASIAAVPPPHNNGTHPTRNQRGCHSQGWIPLTGIRYGLSEV